MLQGLKDCASCLLLNNSYSVGLVAVALCILVASFEHVVPSFFHSLNTLFADFQAAEFLPKRVTRGSTAHLVYKAS